MGRKSDKHTIEGVSNREESKKGFPIGKVVFVIALLASVALPFTELGGKILDKAVAKLRGKTKIIYKEKIVYKDKIEDKIIVKIASIDNAKPIQSHDDASQKIESLTTLSGSSDILLETSIDAQQSEELASHDRKQPESYKIDYEVKLRLPKAAQSMSELELMSPELSSVLPGLSKMLEQAEVSPYYFTLYNNKTNRVKRDATELKALISRHNFFDLQTILNLTSESGRKMTLIQADMDVVSDGSDGDRLPVMPERIVNSSNYQLSTSYFWKKQTDTPNPMIVGVKGRIEKAKEEIALSSTTVTRKTWLSDRIKWLETKLEDMKHHSYLIAEHDPFIVMPVNMITDREDEFAPKAGDYAVVVCKGKVYPCIVGDGGPDYKMGEASLRLAKAINSTAGVYSRPVSDLSVTYVVFPNSRDQEKKPPNYKEWREKCFSLLGEVGGLSDEIELHTWENTLP